jgi:alcohol dehydrogenase
MEIQGAVLRDTGRPRPYRESMPLAIETLLLDDPGPGELRLRIEAAGVCHSDLSVVDGTRSRPLPMLLGHEASGIVDAVGPGVERALLGRRVATTFLPRCGECTECGAGGRLPCRRGAESNRTGALLSGAVRLHDEAGAVRHHLGVSGFATHAVLDHRSVVAVGDDVPPVVAALSGCAVVNAGGMNASDDVAIIGLGGVGMAALIVAVALAGPGRRVIGIDQNPDKLATARALGATEVWTPSEARESAAASSLVIEAAGHPLALEAAIPLTADGGRIVTVGLPSPSAVSRVPPLAITSRALTIIGSYQGSSVAERDIPRIIELWRGGLPIERLASAPSRLSDINLALDRLAEGQGVRQVIAWGNGG